MSKKLSFNFCDFYVLSSLLLVFKKCNVLYSILKELVPDYFVLFPSFPSFSQNSNLLGKQSSFTFRLVSAGWFVIRILVKNMCPALCVTDCSPLQQCMLEELNKIVIGGYSYSSDRCRTTHAVNDHLPIKINHKTTLFYCYVLIHCQLQESDI